MRTRRTRPVVLVVDDCDLLRATLHEILQDDYEVLEAEDGPTAIKLAGSAPIDLVLLDLVMPGPSGFEVITELTGVRSGVRIVVLSAVRDASAAAYAMRLEAVDYVVKPFENEMLLEVLHAALRPGLRSRPPALASGRPSIGLVGCDVTVAAGIAAAFHSVTETTSHPEPAITDFTATTPQSLFVVDAHTRQADWLDRAALLLQRFAAGPAIVLVDAGRAEEARFFLGEACIAVERPFQLRRILGLIGTACPNLSVVPIWSDERVAAVSEHIAANYARSSIRRVANDLGVTPGHLSRWFRGHTGVSIGKWVTRTRVYAARHLLAHGATKLEAVAATVGFHDASHLSRAFLGVTGQRPGRAAARMSGAGAVDD